VKLPEYFANRPVILAKKQRTPARNLSHGLNTAEHRRVCVKLASARQSILAGEGTDPGSAKRCPEPYSCWGFDPSVPFLLAWWGADASEYAGHPRGFVRRAISPLWRGGVGRQIFAQSASLSSSFASFAEELWY